MVYFSTLVLTFVLLWTGCSTPPVQTETPTREVLLQREAVAENILLAKFEEKLKDHAAPSRPTKEVEIFLRKLGLKLAQGDLETASRPLGVILTRKQEFAGKSFGIPGNRLYVPVPLLRALHTESEWAAVLGFELAHLTRHSLAYRWDPEKQAGDLFGLAGLFSFDERDHKDAVERAVRLLYAAGYDPRGIVGYFAALQKFPEPKPYSEDTILMLESVARKAVARLAPLRNPLVRSPEFLQIQTWVEKL